MPLDTNDWIAAYGQAWRAKDADAVAALFTENAIYSSSPFREPHVGQEGIRAYWRGATVEQESLTLRFGEPLVDGKRAAVEWWATMTDQGWATAEGASDERLTLPGCLILRFNNAGLCEELREYWHVAFGETQSPAEGWRR